MTRSGGRFTRAAMMVAALVVSASGIAGLMFASSAPAANEVSPFGCRASALRTELGGSAVEPIVANAQTSPCQTQSAGANSASTPSSIGASAGTAGAFTYETGSAGGATAPGAAAVASVQAVSVPTSSGAVTIAGPVQASASYACVNNQVQPLGNSTLSVVSVNGQAQQIPGDKPETIPLGGGAYMNVNEEIQTATSITERVLDIHLASGSEIVVGEAEVTQNSPDPCAGTSSGVPPVLEICPQGSTLDTASQQCVISSSSGGGAGNGGGNGNSGGNGGGSGNGSSNTTTVVSRPFSGPSGGTVETLVNARKRYPNSPCLTGPGPKYALVATKRGARVTGTPHSDRILALGAGERVAGLAGNDCVDGTGRGQTLFDGNGKDRVYGGSGTTRIAVGNGNDYVNGRSGHDWITAGNGNDTVWGGQAAARIDVGVGRDRVYGGRGKNRIWAAGDRAFVSCGAGKHNTAFVRPSRKRYALSHGCRYVWPLK